MTTTYIERYGTFDRVLHWTAAVSFFVLVLSGLGLYAQTFFGYFNFFGGPQNGILAHKWASGFFFISSVVLFLRHAAETCRFDEDDRRWFKAFGGYLTRDKSKIPQGKYNAGQKVFGIFAFTATLIMGVTGIIIWDPTFFARALTQWSLMLHSLFFTLFMMGIIVHIYLATIGNPGTLEGMLWGRVRKVWAQRHAIKWYRQVTGRH